MFCRGLSLVLLVFVFRSLSSRVLLRLLSLFSCFVICSTRWLSREADKEASLAIGMQSLGLRPRRVDLVIPSTWRMLLPGPVVWLTLVRRRIRLAGGAGSGVVTSLGMIRIACTLRGVRWRFQSFMNQSVGLSEGSVLFDKSPLTRYAFTHPI